jgi:nucleotide-binding universal stress UspA family protein
VKLFEGTIAENICRLDPAATSEAIVAAARKHGCDAIFMATHARTGLARLWHGSRTEEVLTHSAIPTLVYR